MLERDFKVPTGCSQNAAAFTTEAHNLHDIIRMLQPIAEYEGCGQQHF